MSMYKMRQQRPIKSQIVPTPNYIWKLDCWIMWSLLRVCMRSHKMCEVSVREKKMLP